MIRSGRTELVAGEPAVHPGHREGQAARRRRASRQPGEVGLTEGELRALDGPAVDAADRALDREARRVTAPMSWAACSNPLSGRGADAQAPHEELELPGRLELGSRRRERNGEEVVVVGLHRRHLILSERG